MIAKSGQDSPESTFHFGRDGWAKIDFIYWMT